MFTKVFALLGLVTVMMMPGALSTEAEAPLYGAMELQFNLAWPGPQEEIPDWVGTITIDGVEYGMAFFNTGTGKPFADNPSNQVFFEETWVIYEELEFAFDGFVLTEFVPGDVVLAGYDRGVVTVVNSSYRMNGDVRTATGGFAGWFGGHVHMSGDIVWGDDTVYPAGAPQYAPGILRVN